jgi:predicted transcriptional regulator
MELGLEIKSKINLESHGYTFVANIHKQESKKEIQKDIN